MDTALAERRARELAEHVAHLETRVRLLSECCRALLKLVPGDKHHAATEALERFYASQEAANDRVR